MMEQLSNDPCPGFNEATDDVLMRVHINQPILQQEYGIQKKTLRNKIYSMIEHDNPQYSYAAWVSGGMDDYVKETIDFLDKRKKARKKIKACIKTCALIFRIYQQVIEERYKPNGAFETEMSLYWNPILQGLRLDVSPPPPPSQLKLASSNN